VLDGGKITELGSHPELVAAEGTYAKMFALQAAQFISPGGSPPPGPPWTQAGTQ